MKISEYFIDLENAIDEIKKNKYKIIALQQPEGLKNSITKIVDYIEKETNCKTIIIADPCFGACDIAKHELKNLKVDFVIQIGHTPIPNLAKNVIPTAFINALSIRNINKVIEKAIDYLDGKKIGIVTTAQHLHTIDKIQKILKNHNFTPIISNGDERIYAKGQILGCNFSAGLKILNKVDSFLFVGSGTFHPIGLLLSTKKPVIAADPYINHVKKQELIELKNTILKQRYGAIAISKNAKKFGILVSIKQGQQRLKLAFKIKEKLEKLEKKSLLIALDNITSIYLQNYRNIDCFVSTSCPRIAIDDYQQYNKPIITPIELEIVIGKREWKDYLFDQL